MDLSVAELKQQIDTEYKAAKLGLVGLSSGTSRHTVITAKMERMNETREKLQTLVGDSAIGIIANVIDSIPDKLSRNDILSIIRNELHNTMETEYLIDQITDMWETQDMIIERFGSDIATIIMSTPSL